MGGLFGGLLGLFSVIGGGLLYLLIGKAAWKDNQTASWWRVILGGIIVGLILGFICVEIIISNLQYDVPWFAFIPYTILGAFVIGIIAACLEGIRLSIERKDSK